MCSSSVRLVHESQWEMHRGAISLRAPTTRTWTWTLIQKQLCKGTMKETRKHRLFTEEIQSEIIALSVWE